RSYFSPQRRTPVATSRSSAEIDSASPRRETAPVKTAPTPSLRPASWGSEVPLNRNTVARAMTFNDGTRNIWSIRLSVSPSLRYSASGSPLAFANGRTARDEIVLLDAPNHLHAAAAASASAMRAATATAGRRRAKRVPTGARGGAGAIPTSVSASEGADAAVAESPVPR